MNEKKDIDDQSVEKQQLLEYYLLQYEDLSKKEQELEIIKDMINSINPTEDSWMNIYNFIFVKGNIKDTNKFLVHVGSNIFIEKSKDELLNVLQKNLDDVKNMKVIVKKEIEKLSKD